MNVVIFGATGMVGQGVLRECLRDPGVERIVTVGRSATGVVDAKVQDVVHADLLNFAAVAEKLTNVDACFFCLGVASVGMSEVDYQRVTYGIAVAAAEVLLRNNTALTFIFVSGIGADSSEKGRVMWARVKGKAENALLRMPFAAVYVFRPGYIQPLDGIKSRTRFYRSFYSVTAPILPLLRLLFANYIVTTREIGRAMLHVARTGAPKKILESSDITELAK